MKKQGENKKKESNEKATERKEDAFLHLWNRLCKSKAVTALRPLEYFTHMLLPKRSTQTSLRARLAEREVLREISRFPLPDLNLLRISKECSDPRSVMVTRGPAPDAPHLNH